MPEISRVGAVNIEHGHFPVGELWEPGFERREDKPDVQPDEPVRQASACPPDLSPADVPRLSPPDRQRRGGPADAQPAERAPDAGHFMRRTVRRGPGRQAPEDARGRVPMGSSHRVGPGTGRFLLAVVAGRCGAMDATRSGPRSPRRRSPGARRRTGSPTHWARERDRREGQRDVVQPARRLRPAGRPARQSPRGSRGRGGRGPCCGPRPYAGEPARSRSPPTRRS